jgi:hypothetical protein
VDIEAFNGAANDVHEKICDMIPEQICVPGPTCQVCTPNPAHIKCKNLEIAAIFLAYSLSVQASIAFYVIDETYDIATLGEYDLAFITLFLCKTSGS